MTAPCPKCVITSGGPMCITACPVVEAVARELAAIAMPDHEDHYWRVYIADARRVVAAVDRARQVPRETSEAAA